MPGESSGQLMLRKETIEKTVQGFALQEYVMKQLVAVSPSSSWKESYFAETATELTGGANQAIRGIPRLSAFPTASVTWAKRTAYIEKYGIEDTISFEDVMSNEVDVIARTLLRISRAVVNAVDTQIWNVLTESQTAVDINTIAITAGNEWNSATVANRDPIQNILDAIREIQIDNYNALNNGFLVLNPTDHANLLVNANVRNAGQFYTSEVTSNGRIGRILGLTIIVSNTVTADYAAVIVAKECGAWKEAEALTVITKIDDGISYTIRAWEFGVAQLINPGAVCLISNTAV